MTELVQLSKQNKIHKTIDFQADKVSESHKINTNCD